MPVLIQQLVKKGILERNKATNLEYEVKTSNKREEEVILEQNITSEDFLFNLKSEILKIPVKKITPEEIPLKVLELIPEESAHYYQLIPLSVRDKIVEIGMVYPEDLKAQEALKFLARQGKFEYRVFLITPKNFIGLLKQYKTLKKEVTKALEELETELKLEKKEIPSLKEGEFEKLVAEAPITKVVAVMLRHAVEGNASDIHVEPGRERTRIRFRLDGVLHPSLFLPKRIHPGVVVRIKIISNLRIDETRVPQDGRFSAKFDDKDVDFRVSTFPTVYGEKVVMRILDPTLGLKSFDELGLEGRNYEVAKRALERPFGLILATGPTGCGKTSTLYAILRILNKEGVNIVTLEDPVEYNLEGINQSQIRPDIGYSYATGLRYTLRQDPDIIMVGEIRDAESAALAVQAALIGRIVLSTLHTNDVVAVIPRLLDLKVPPFLLPATLNIVLAQRLVRCLCEHCKSKVTPTDEIKNLILRETEQFPLNVRKTVHLPKDLKTWEPKGCQKCRFTGYSGRIGVFEVLEMTNGLAEIIVKDPSEVKLREEAKRQGMITMKQDGILKVLDGITSIQEVLRVTEEQ